LSRAISWRPVVWSLQPSENMLVVHRVTSQPNPSWGSHSKEHYFCVCAPWDFKSPYWLRTYSRRRYFRITIHEGLPLRSRKCREQIECGLDPDLYLGKHTRCGWSRGAAGPSEDSQSRSLQCIQDDHFYLICAYCPDATVRLINISSKEKGCGRRRELTSVMFRLANNGATKHKHRKMRDIISLLFFS
jgi:hypothetical protein